MNQITASRVQYILENFIEAEYVLIKEVDTEIDSLNSQVAKLDSEIETKYNEMYLYYERIAELVDQKDLDETAKYAIADKIRDHIEERLAKEKESQDSRKKDT